MLKQLKSQKGFTLIELMIVVAIIGILAAIAIPNFLTYQLKSRQAEAKTNLQAIKTSEVAFQAERGCYVGMVVEVGLRLGLARLHLILQEVRDGDSCQDPDDRHDDHQLDQGKTLLPF